MHRQGQWASLPCYVQSSALLARYLAHLLHQDCVFSLPEPGTIVFKLHVLSAILQLLHLSCLFLMFIPHILMLMQELVFGRLNRRIAQHCNCVRRIRRAKGNRWSYWWRRAVRKPLEPRSYTLSMRLFVRFPQTTPIVGTWFVCSPRHQQHNVNLQKSAGCLSDT